MKTTLRTLSRLLLCAGLLAGAGCAQLGPLEDVVGAVLTPAGAGGELTGEVQYVDTRSQRIELHTRDGRRTTVAYDRSTRVVYQDREYPVSALERGDEISLRVQRGERGELYTDYIYVQRSVSSGGAGGYDDQGRVQRLEGTVEYVDYSRGQFEVRDNRSGRTVLVTLPYGAAGNDVDRFRRLRRGDYVRLEVEQLTDRRAELRRFI